MDEQDRRQRALELATLEQSMRDWQAETIACCKALQSVMQAFRDHSDACIAALERFNSCKRRLAERVAEDG